jgi:hypothetical protein
MDIKVIERESMDRIYLVQDKAKQRAAFNAVMNLPIV